MLCLTTLAETSLGLALGTARGVVKRVNPEVLGRDAWEVIRLEPGDTVVGAVELTSEAHELTFITNDAQLLHFPAASVRPQGRSGGGMAGIKLGVGASAVFFGVVPTAAAGSCGGRHGLRLVEGAARHRPGGGQGHVLR